MSEENSINPSDTALLWTHDIDSDHVYKIDEAVGMYIYECEYNGEKPAEVITMHAFKHKEMNADWFADGALEDLIMRLDEEHGHPEDATEPTQQMKDAALAFVRAVTAEYTVWQVESIGRIEIKISDYWSAS